MKNNKKILSLVLALVVTVSVLGAFSLMFPAESGGDGPSKETTSTLITEPAPNRELQWTVQKAFTNNLQCVIVDNDRLIAAGYGGKFYVSEDGVSFETVSLDLPYELNSNHYILDIIKVEERFWFVDRFNGIYSCSENFTDCKLEYNGSDLRSFAYANGEFFAVSPHGSVHFDGEKWVQYEDFSYDVCVAKGIYGGEVFYFVNASRCLFSLDEYGTFEVLFGASSYNNPVCIEYIGDHIYIGGKFATLDRIDMRTGQTSFTATLAPDSSEAYVYDFVEFDGKLYFCAHLADANSTALIFYSDDGGANWQACENADFTGKITDLIVFKDSLFAFCDNGKYYIGSYQEVE